jgi:hypothetical protein
MTVGFFVPAKMVWSIAILFAGSVRKSAEATRLFVLLWSVGKGNTMQEKRDIAVTIWCRESEISRLENVSEKIAGSNGSAALRPQRSTLAHAMFVSGLVAFEKRKRR